jgi:hypothetical protein
MNWAEIFPIFADEDVLTYRQRATMAERAEMKAHYRVLNKIGGRKADHIVSISLFWKNVFAEDPDLPQPTRELMMTAVERDLVRRYDPWLRYVEPTLAGAKALAARGQPGTLPNGQPTAQLRVHLASDLSFLIPELIEAGAEVWVMASSSVRHEPGSTWRFLALAECGPQQLVTISDAHRLGEIEADLQRTEAVKALGLSWWRVPNLAPLNSRAEVEYRPVVPGHLGCRMPIRRIKSLLEAFAWATIYGDFSKQVTLPSQEVHPFSRTTWPSNGYDQWFLTVVLYPRLLKGGTLTLAPVGGRSELFAYDLEFTTWMNRKSEVIPFGQVEHAHGGVQPEGGKNDVTIQAPA